MSLMGTKISQFSMPVCTSFKAKILKDQLCYEVDVDKYKRKGAVEDINSLELTLLIDSNKERFITSTERKENPRSGDNIGELYKLLRFCKMIIFSFQLYRAREG